MVSFSCTVKDIPVGAKEKYTTSLDEIVGKESYLYFVPAMKEFCGKVITVYEHPGASELFVLITSGPKFTFHKDWLKGFKLIKTEPKKEPEKSTLSDEQKEKVLKVLNRSPGKAPLVFFDSKKEEFIKKPPKDFGKLRRENLEDSVKTIIHLSRLYESRKENDVRRFCRPRANRSSGDIWRHLIYFLPDVTIFEVMNSLHNLVMQKVVCTMFCYDVRKRVFNFSDYKYYADFDRQDEYGLIFASWNSQEKE